MKNSFLYQKYRMITFGLGLFIIGLIIFFGISITITSRLYLDRFVAHNKQMTESYLEIFQEDAAIRVSRWSICSNTKSAFLDGDGEELDRIFTQRVKTIGFPDVRILIREPGASDYLYEGREIPKELLEVNHREIMRDHCFRWVGDELWYTASDQIDDYLVFMSVPIRHENLKELALYLEGNLLENIQITKKSIDVDRDIFHWKRLIFSVPIDEKVHAYLTYTFNMKSLSEYFYWSYGITTLAILLFFAWIIRYRLKSMILEAQQQMLVFEGEIKQIAEGDYSRKIQETGYYEFDRLGMAVNHLTDTIEERNHELSEHVQELYSLLVTVLEQKDPYTRGHSERVAKYAKGIANMLGIENAEEIHAAGLLHDVGKIAIPEELLNKPGRFEDHEYERVKEHARKGYDLLKESREFERIRYWVLFHHERIDGSGYPEGLKGMEIPYESRIIAVADVFDAMTSDRSYRSAMTQEEALKFLHAKKGICFQSEIVEALETYLKASSKG